MSCMCLIQGHMETIFQDDCRPTCLKNQTGDVVIFIRSFQSHKMTTKACTEIFGISSGLAGL